MKWIYRKGAADFSAMSDLKQEFRTELEGVAAIEVPEIVTEQRSTDGTRKWMLRMDEVQGIETVYHPRARSRHALHLEPGRMRHGLYLLFHRSAGIQSQPERR